MLAQWCTRHCAAGACHRLKLRAHLSTEPASREEQSSEGERERTCHSIVRTVIPYRYTYSTYTGIPTVPVLNMVIRTMVIWQMSEISQFIAVKFLST